MPPRQPELQGTEAFLAAVRDQGGTLRELYRGDPEGLANRLGLSLPEKPVTIMIRLGVITQEEARERFGETLPGLRELVLEVCLLEEESAVAVGPRGGGKSQGVSFIEFYLWIIMLFDALNLGGSELQANNVYEYLLAYLDSDPYWKTLLKGDPKVSETWTKDRAWIRVLTASQKSVRSPHAGGLRNVNGSVVERGGLLVIDEEAEADPDIVAAALPTINTARPSVNVRCSTFHNATGSFADVVDHHEEMGYKMYRWDIFDICAGCDCTGDSCESEEACFREDHYEDYIDPDDDNRLKRRLLHKAYCGGRAKYAQGWLPFREILKLWRRIRRNHSQFEVEAMGSRPASGGKVIKDQNKFLENVTSRPAVELYQPGAAVSICVDWGTGAAGLEVWQEQWPGRHALLYAEQLEEAGETQILGAVIGQWMRYPEAMEIAADIGGGGNYLNKKLRDEMGYPVRDVNFNTEKEAAVAALNIFSEANAIDIPDEFDEYIEQGKLWRRKNGQIQKGNDHLMDAGVCYFAKFIDQLGVSGLRVAPQPISTGGTSQGPMAPSQGSRGHSAGRSRPTVPIVAGIGLRRNR